MKHFLFLAALINIFIVNSCKKYEPAPGAFFIKPSNVSVAPTSTAQGSSSHKITDLFLYVNGQFQGAYAAGNPMPIVTNNQQVTVNIFAGIKENGIQDKSTTWLFYDQIQIDTLVESGKTIDRPLTFRYNPNVTFAWTENFDNPIGTSLIKSAGYSDTSFTTVSSAEAFEGKSIEIALVGNDPKVGQFESSEEIALPSGNSNVYMELNYKCNTVFEVGVLEGSLRRGALNINPKAEWNKIYIHLSTVVNQYPVLSKYKIYFRVEKPNGAADAYVWLDNIKVIYI